MKGGADSVKGWQLLCKLQLQNEQYSLAADSAAQGLKCLHHKQNRGYPCSPSGAAAIVLARGHSLLALERPVEAMNMFTALTGIVGLCFVDDENSRVLVFESQDVFDPANATVAQYQVAARTDTCDTLMNCRVAEVLP